MTKLTQISAFIGALSFATIALVQTGVIKSAHAISLNGAIRILTEEIKASEARLTDTIEKSCMKAE